MTQLAWQKGGERDFWKLLHYQVGGKNTLKIWSNDTHKVVFALN